MHCQTCQSNRILKINAHAKDLFDLELNGIEKSGYLPKIKNIGSGDDLSINVCLSCGQIQGTWPVGPVEFELEEDYTAEFGVQE